MCVCVCVCEDDEQPPVPHAKRRRVDTHESPPVPQAKRKRACEDDEQPPVPQAKRAKQQPPVKRPPKQEISALAKATSAGLLQKVEKTEREPKVKKGEGAAPSNLRVVVFVCACCNKRSDFIILLCV